MTQPAADTSKDATDEAEKAEEAIGGEQVVQADVHQQATQEPEDTQDPEGYPLDEEDDEEDEEDKEEDLDEDLQDPDFEVTEEGANVIGTLRVKVHIFQPYTSKWVENSKFVLL